MESWDNAVSGGGGPLYALASIAGLLLLAAVVFAVAIDLAEQDNRARAQRPAATCPK